MKKHPKPDDRVGTAKIPASDYQPSKAELEEDVRIPMPFRKAVEMLARPVRLEFMGKSKD